MQIDRIEKMKGGWFTGDFDPSVYRTSQFEVSYKIHKKDEQWETHYHKVATEINFLSRGKMILQGKTLTAGDIFTLYPGEIADPQFLEECELVVIKTPSVKGDKYDIKNMRTAICMSGQPREISETWPTFMEHFLPSFPNPEVFIYAPEPYPTEFLDAVEPKAYVVEPQFKHEHVENELFKNINSQKHLVDCIQQFYGLKKVWELRRRYEHDFVVRVRPDYIYLKPIPMHLFDMNKLTQTGVEFAAGAPKVVDAFFNMYDFLFKEGSRLINKDTHKRFGSEIMHSDIISTICCQEFYRRTFHEFKNPYTFYRILRLHKNGGYKAYD